MDLELNGPSLPPRFTQKPHPSVVYTRIFTWNTRINPPIPSTSRQDLTLKHSDRRKHKSKPIHKSQSSAEEDESSAYTRGFTQPQLKVPPEPQPQAISDSVFYREVDMNDLPSQFTEKIETFRQFLDHPDPWKTMPRSSTPVLGLDD